MYIVEYEIHIYEENHSVIPECTASTGCIGSTGKALGAEFYALTLPCSVPNNFVNIIFDLHYIWPKLFSAYPIILIMKFPDLLNTKQLK